MHNYNWWVESTANTWEATRRKSRKSKNWQWRDLPQYHSTVFRLNNTSRNMSCPSSNRPWRQLLSTDPKTPSNSSATTCLHNATNDQIAYPPTVHNHANKESINTQSAISTPPESRCLSSEAALWLNLIFSWEQEAGIAPANLLLSWIAASVEMFGQLLTQYCLAL